MQMRVLMTIVLNGGRKFLLICINVSAGPVIQPDGGEQGIDSQVVNVGDRVSMECIVTGKFYIMASCEIALLKAYVQNYTLNAHADLFRFCLNFHLQGSHRLEKYLNLECFLEKSLKIKSTLKSTGKSLKSLEKSLNCAIFCRT